MDQETQETRMENNPLMLLNFQQQPRNQRKFPIPKEINRYILQYYAVRYYHAKPDERSIISQEISTNIGIAGYKIAPEEIDRRFKNMKAHYRRKKDDFQNGIVKSIEWEYFQFLDGIFADQIPKRRYTRIQPVYGPSQEEKPVEQQSNDYPPCASSQSSPPHFLIPKIVMNIENETPENDKNASKRSSLAGTESQQAKKVKAEKSSKDKDSDDDKLVIAENPLDMSLKKPKVIQFNNIGDIAQQLPISNVNAQTEDGKNAAIKRISEEFQKLDQERLLLDEMRLSLEIKRNEIDKAAYTLSTLLNDIIKS